MEEDPGSRDFFFLSSSAWYLMNDPVACVNAGEGRTIPGVDSKVIEVYQGYVF